MIPAIIVIVGYALWRLDNENTFFEKVVKTSAASEYESVKMFPHLFLSTRPYFYNRPLNIALISAHLV